VTHILDMQSSCNCCKICDFPLNATGVHAVSYSILQDMDTRFIFWKNALFKPCKVALISHVTWNSSVVSLIGFQCFHVLLVLSLLLLHKCSFISELLLYFPLRTKSLDCLIFQLVPCDSLVALE
jgi:hypothetical protein